MMQNRRIVMMCAVLTAILMLGREADAHVQLDAPNGGEVLEVGSTFTVRWHIVIAHNLLNWDLWYSTNSAFGPWVPFATNLPAGSGAVGSVHLHSWTIPAAAISDTVWVRVRMDNSATDYEDVSNQSFKIVAAPCPADTNGDGNIDVTDLLAVLGQWGSCPNPCPPSCTADTNNDCVVDVTDLLTILGAWGSCP